MSPTGEYGVRLPFEGMEGIKLFSPGATLIAIGYERIVIGGRGPYIEFSDRHMVKENIFVPAKQEWRRTGRYQIYYHEYRSTDENMDDQVKIYYQVKPVDYADYRVGYWYVSPYEVKSDLFPEIVDLETIDKRQIVP